MKPSTLVPVSFHYRQSLFFILGLVMLCNWFAPAHAAQICEFKLIECPEAYNGDTILVSDEVIAMSPSVPACLSSVVFSDIANSTKIPSIVFVIDHSGSMTGVNSQESANDRWGTRFVVTRALLDTIYKAQPNAEVGLVVFREHLFFDPTTTEYFSKFFQRMPTTYDNEPDQAYLPLMRLNQLYDGKKGIDIIKDVLITDSIAASGYQYVDLRYKPAFSTSGYTNINIGFEAAKHAFTNAANPKEQQFVIFLSDGEPKGSDQAGFATNYFTRGVNVPTTFTVYFTGDGSAPSSLQTMTQNIRSNGYSSSNPQSQLWTLQTTYSDLLRLFMESIMSNILIPGNPTRMVVNGTRTSTTYIGGSFVFSSVFPLDNSVTRYDMSMTYRYTDLNDRIIRDSTITTTFFIKRAESAATSSRVSVSCVDAPVQTGGYIPVTATLMDTDGDGYLDRIDLTWTDTASIKTTMPTVSELISKLQITTHDGKTIDLSAAGITPDLAQNRIRITLNENSGSTLETGWKSSQILLTTVPMANNGRHFVVTQVIDKAGPVVKEVWYYKDQATGKDSIVVVFSEPVSWQPGGAMPSQVFEYFREKNPETGAFAGIPAGDLAMQPQSAVVIMSNDFEPIGNIDSLRIRGTTDRLTDMAANAPPANGRKAPVQFGGNEFRMAVINNPLIPGVSMLPASVIQFYSNILSSQGISGSTPGMIVGIQTTRPLEARPDGSYGQAFIYDAVGNLVSSNVSIYQASGATDYGVFWDGRNRNNRYVGAGGYLMSIKAVDIDGKKKSEKVKLGIKR